MRPVLFSDIADEELGDTLTASTKFGPYAAARFRRIVDMAIDELGSGLITGAFDDDTRCRVYVLRRVTYSLIYLDDPDAIRIVAVAHRS